MFDKMSVSKLGDEDGEAAAAMRDAVELVREAIATYVGVNCDIAIGVHFQPKPGSPCSALVVTPEGMDIGLACKTLYLGLAGLQLMMAEMPSPDETLN